MRGSLAAMLELGAGFQPDLSGRDNIFLNGSLLGLSRADIEKRYDAIVAFAELEDFIDNQVKFYSSGMYVRLGFAVAVNVEPDVLLVDEVLAVGDASFQRKCLDHVKKFQREGRTIVVVSHATDVIRQNCSRVMVMNHGQVITVDEPGEGIRVFLADLLGVGTLEDSESGGIEGNVLAIGTCPRRTRRQRRTDAPLPRRVAHRHRRCRQPGPCAQRHGHHRHPRRPQRAGLRLRSRRPDVRHRRPRRWRHRPLPLPGGPTARRNVLGERRRSQCHRDRHLRLEGPGHQVRGGQPWSGDRPGAPAARRQLPAAWSRPHRRGARGRCRVRAALPGWEESTA